MTSAQISSALDTARKAKAEGGGFKKIPHVPNPKPKRQHLHVGPVHSAVAGRTDHLPTHVPSGSYVLPADIVSAHGEGNTVAGFKVMRRTFGGTPYSQGSAPYGQSGGPYGEPLGKAHGGEVDHGVPVVIAGGEYVLSPDQVRWAGNGSLEEGHKALDAFVLRSREKLIKTLKHLPGPSRS